MGQEDEIKEMKANLLELEEQVRLLVKTELRLRRTKSELIKSREAITEYSRTLEQKVEERTRELKRLNEGLIDFTNIASHDLQEPLRKISAFGERLKLKYYSVLEDTGRDYLDRIQNASARMQNLIDALLAYSRLNTKAEPFTSTDLSQIVKDVLADLEVRIEKVSGRVELGPLPMIEADPIQMRQLFQNLIGNALKFHKPDMPPVVKVCTLEKSIAGFCSMVVEDNGIGIEEKYYEKIFGVFQRLHRKEEYEGSGIGLSICKRIIQRHSGSISLESKLSEGTKFVILLPYRQDNPQ